MTESDTIPPDLDDDTGDVDELTIIHSVLRQLDKLDDESQKRVLAYVCHRTGLWRMKPCESSPLDPRD